MLPSVEMKERPKYYGQCEKLPFQKGDKVFIPKGTPVLSMHPKDEDSPEYDAKFGNPYNRITKKGQWITIAHIHNGWSELRASENAHRNPSITWAGAGKYWVEVDINYLVQ